MIGIISYGAYIPKFRIKPSQIALAWGKSEEEVEKSLKINARTRPVRCMSVRLTVPTFRMLFKVICSNCSRKPSGSTTTVLH